MKGLYPLKFKTIFKDKIWGGNKIKTVLNKDYTPLPNCGETWEVSGMAGNVSVVKEGPLEGKSLTSLLSEYGSALVGKKVYDRYGDQFPLLIKFIDANEDLSIQVHPNDELAQKRHNSFGKTEMWYIIQSDDGAKLISGFSKEVNEKVYLDHVASNRLDDILNQEQARSNDVFFLPAGRVHTIGKGLLLAEIQQSSDITYRIYDFDRKDDQGNKRELHTEQALAAIDYKTYDTYKTEYEDRFNEVVNLITCPYFVTNKLHFNKTITRSVDPMDSFVIYICLEGNVSLNWAVNANSASLSKGDVILVPASIPNITLISEGEYQLLESYVP